MEEDTGHGRESGFNYVEQPSQQVLSEDELQTEETLQQTFEVTNESQHISILEQSGVLSAAQKNTFQGGGDHRLSAKGQNNFTDLNTLVTQKHTPSKSNFVNKRPINT